MTESGLRFDGSERARQVAAAKWLTYERIRSDKHGALVVGLMIAANDILMANWNAMEWGEENEQELPRLRRHLRIGAQQYFVRLMVSHLHEALHLVREFRELSRVGRHFDKMLSPSTVWVRRYL